MKSLLIPILFMLWLSVFTLTAQKKGLKADSRWAEFKQQNFERIFLTHPNLNKKYSYEVIHMKNTSLLKIEQDLVEVAKPIG